MANTTQDIIDRITAGLFALFGNDINTNPNEPIGQIISLFANSDTLLYQLSDSIRAQFNLSKTTGEDLNNLSKLFLAARQKATPSTMSDVVLTGTAGTIIPAGSQIGYENFQTFTDTFTLNTAVTLDGGGLGTGTFSDDIDGARTIDTGQNFIILTQVQGWDEVDPSGAMVVIGENFQDDPAFRNDLQFESSKNGTNLVDTLSGDLLNLNIVIKVKVYEYKTDTTNPIFNTDFFLADLGFFEPIVVLSSSLPIQEQYDQVAQIIWHHKPPAIISFSEQTTAGEPTLDVTGTAVDTLGNDKTINFSLGLADDFSAAIDITPIAGQSFDFDSIEADIKSALAAYINELGIGDLAIYSLAFCVIVSSNTTYSFSIQSFTWTDVNNVAVTTDIQIPSRSYGVLLESNITVTEV
jgi:uncharacterized phage protein gp47/JayE